MTIVGSLWGIFLQCPSHYFLVTYGDLCVMHIMWARCIEQLESVEDIMKESKHFLNALNKVTTIISSPVFWVITQLQIGLILWFFITLTFISICCRYLLWMAWIYWKSWQLIWNHVAVGVLLQAKWRISYRSIKHQYKNT